MVYVEKANIEHPRQSNIDLKLSIVCDHMSYELQLRFTYM